MATVKKPAMKPWMVRFLNLYPPYLGAGIRIERVDDWTFRSSMKLRRTNRNYFGTHFGGSLYSMCDPFFALLLSQHIGREYIVWDKAAEILFRRPGTGKVHADFHLPPKRLVEIQQQADELPKVEPRFETAVVDEDEKVVAVVKKLLYVRKKATKEAG